MLGERERHSLADFERMQHDFYSLPGRRDRPPPLAPSSAKPARRARDRAAQELGRAPGRPHDRRDDLSRVHGRVRADRGSGRSPRRAACRALPEQVRRRALRGRVLPVALPGAHAGAVGRGRPGLVRRRPGGPRGGRGTRSRWRRSRPALDGLEERLRPRLRPLALGARPRRRVRPPVRRGEPASSGGSSTASSRPAARARRSTQNGYLATAPFKGVWGPVYRMLADLGDPRRSRWQLTTGQSGHPGSAALRRPARGLARRPHEPGLHGRARAPRGRRRAGSCASTRTTENRPSGQEARRDQAERGGDRRVPGHGASHERGLERAGRVAAR